MSGLRQSAAAVALCHVTFPRSGRFWAIDGRNVTFSSSRLAPWAIGMFLTVPS